MATRLEIPVEAPVELISVLLEDREWHEVDPASVKATQVYEGTLVSFVEPGIGEIRVLKDHILARRVKI